MRFVKRFGSVIRVRPEKLDEYRRLHASVWPGVLETIRNCNIRNYSIFYRDGMLFSYYEYIGDDFDGDVARMKQDPVTQEWWKLTDPCQHPVETAGPGDWWAPMAEVFHAE